MDLISWLHAPFLDDDFPLPLDRPFTGRTAREHGVTSRDLRTLIGLGLLRHPIRNCYVPAQLEDDIATRCACLRLVVPEDAIIVDRHAGWLQGADMLLLPNEHLNRMPVTMFLPAGRGRLRNGLADSGERHLRAEDVTEIHGLRVTTPLRTALDMGRQPWPEQAIVALDALHGLGSFTAEQLMAEIPRFKGMRWVTTLRYVAPHSDGRSQSGGESVIRWRWLHLPVPPPEPQIEVQSQGRVALIDVGNDDVRVGLEYDGQEWHTSEDQRAHDATRRDWLDRDADWVIGVLVKEDVFGPKARVEEALYAALKQANARTRRRMT